MSYKFITESVKLIREARDRTLKDFKEKLVEQEPQLTDKLVTRIQDSFDWKEVEGISWRAKILNPQGRGSQESKYGADFMGVLSIDFGKYIVNKGFLAQAKIIKPDKPIGKEGFFKMREQCEKMLKRTADSFVFIYAPDEIFVVPAPSIVSLNLTKEDVQRFRLDSRRLFYHCLHRLKYECSTQTSKCRGDIFGREISNFFRHHFESFIGDRRLSKADIHLLEDPKLEKELENLRKENDARTGVALLGKPSYNSVR